MNVLLLPKYGPLAASARQRFLQYVPYLERHGVRCTISPLLGDDYLAERFRGGHAPPRAVLAALWRRVRALLEAHTFDLAVLHYEVFPYLPPVLERLLGRQVPYLCDYDDAIFHNYDQHRSVLVRRLLGRKIEQVMARSAGVLGGSAYLCRYAARVQRRVAFLPTVVDLDAFPPAPPRGGTGSSPAEAPVRPTRPFTVGWIGSPSTAAYLAPVLPTLRTLAREGEVRLLCVGSGALRVDGVPLEVRPWREDREISDLCDMDVGIMPLPDEPWARGKCGFKLIQYMACSLPTVASPVGANADIVTHGETGLLAQRPDEWLAALRRLRDDAELRARLGRAGRQVVAERYCLAVTAPRLLAFMRETLAPRAPEPALHYNVAQGASP